MLNQTRVDHVFHAFADPTRRKLVERLSQGPASASELAKPLGITLHDHIIIGKSDHASLRSLKLL